MNIVLYHTANVNKKNLIKNSVDVELRTSQNMSLMDFEWIFFFGKNVIFGYYETKEIGQCQVCACVLQKYSSL